jgi:hypothetical protein
MTATRKRNSLHSKCLFDPTYTDVDMRAFIKTNWKPMYGDVKEAIPPNAPVTRGKAIDLRIFVDYDHAGEHFTRCSRTGFVIYLNMAPILCGSPGGSLLWSQVCLGLGLFQ